MKHYVHLWCLPEFFLEWEMFQTEIADKIKTYILCSKKFYFAESFCLFDNVQRYVRTRKATDNIIRQMRTACWITTATDTNSELLILIAFAR